MLYLKSFTFNPFQQNTYIVYNSDNLAWIIDPGNCNNSEDQQIKNFISEKKLKLERLLLTHAHLDHIFGNKFIFENYSLLPEVHKDEIFFIDRMSQSAAMYGVSADQSPSPEQFLNDGDGLTLGNYKFECFHTPGHSPGSISFYNEENKILISGDVLFHESIGRSDLPMGNHETLINSIKEKLFVLPDEVKVYSGHGISTTIGHEKKFNPYLT
jgi:hydroxyacylglutathione hydrolase